jgi:hypothetical protein
MIFDKQISTYTLELILMSKGPSLLTMKPLSGVSNCIEETPQSISAPSMLFNGNFISCKTLSKSENLPSNGITRPLCTINKILNRNHLQVENLIIIIFSLKF